MYVYVCMYECMYVCMTWDIYTYSPVPDKKHSFESLTQSLLVQSDAAVNQQAVEAFQILQVVMGEKPIQVRALTLT